MIRIKETIVVEGRYDKARLRGLTDATIIECDGFAIFKDKKKVALLRALAQKDGIIVLTDSDRAGFAIRGYLRRCIAQGSVKHAYIPQILGKERRKPGPSKEGLLGVEGMEEEVLAAALKNAGATGLLKTKERRQEIVTADLYEDGLCGRDNSHALRGRLLLGLDLPTRMGTKALLEVLNTLYSYEEYKEIVSEFIKNQREEREEPRHD